MIQITKDMKKIINLKKLLELHSVKPSELNQLLFPDHKFPGQAIQRIVDGRGELSANQVAILANYLNVSIDSLYEPDEFTLEDIEGDEIVFISGENYQVRLNTSTWVASIFLKGEEIIKDLQADGTMQLGAFLKEVKAEIKNWIELS